MGLRNAWRGLFTSKKDAFSQKRPLRRRAYAGAKTDRLTASWVTRTFNTS